MNTPIYLDFAAATPLAREAKKAMALYLDDQFYNPSALYQSARQVKTALEQARASVARCLGAKPSEIIFTAGGTEANNLAIKGVLAQFPEAHLVVSSIEHESVLVPAQNYAHSLVPVTPKGIVDVPALVGAITDKTVLISVMYANNEIGTIQPLEELAKQVAEVRRKRRAAGNSLPLWLHTDACQAANYLDLQVNRLGVDMMTLNGGKIYALKQSGALFVRAGITLHPLIEGGGQEQAVRSGTENVAAAIPFATMLQKVQKTRKAESQRLAELRTQLFTTLSQSISGLTLNGSPDKRLPNNLNITIPNLDGERLVMALDEAGVLIATGSACQARSEQSSHVLRALGLSEASARSSLRLTLGRSTTSAAISQAAQRICQVIGQELKLV